MAMSWGPVGKPVCRHEDVAVGAEGEVTRGTVPSSTLGSPSHPVNYSATDARHGHERDMMGWPSIDHNSGPVTESDWANSTGHFPDGPGAWRQT